MLAEKRTARENLEIKSAFAYFVLYFIMAIIAHSFQLFAHVNLSEIIKTSSINLLAITIAYIIYKRKKYRKSTTILEWIIGFITLTIPIIAKYSYAKKYDWTFAIQSYNSTILLVIFLVMLQLYYNKKLIIFYTFYAILNWAIFLYIAVNNGAEVYWDAVIDGKPVHGAVMMREIFLAVVTVIFSVVAYRAIAIVQEYDDETSQKNSIIKKQADNQKVVNIEIQSKSDDLLEQVKVQDELTYRFNEKMQNQASTFEEISATLEELLSSSENIANIAADQVKGNETMEQIIQEFKNIKNETRKNLDNTISKIELVVDQTGDANEQIKNIESTINEIRNQSEKISNTINVIVDIADKINLLSLNASIEAARAGDYGKGFAVVADEIGKLAYRTSESIKEIESVLDKSSATTQQGVEVIGKAAEMMKQLITQMTDSSKDIKILQDSIIVEEKYISNIISQMLKNVETAKSIGSATEEQKTAIESSAKAIEQMNSVVSEMVDEINRLAESSQKILNEVKELLEVAKKSEQLDE